MFAPDDLELVKGGPGERRRYLDDTLVAAAPEHDALRTELDRVLRQRNALLRQSGGRLTPEVEATLDVWDAKLVEVGRGPGRRTRRAARASCAPALAEAYDRGGRTRRPRSTVTYRVAVARAGPGRRRWPRRAATSCGAGVTPGRARTATTSPSAIAGLPARTHASQGEQRSLALALRLAAHAVVTEAAGEPADPAARRRVLRARPRPQRGPARAPADGSDVLTTAADLPPGADPDQVVRVENGQTVDL